jgi:hypothetical protein
VSAFELTFKRPQEGSMFPFLPFRSDSDEMTEQTATMQTQSSFSSLDWLILLIMAALIGLGVVWTALSPIPPMETGSFTSLPTLG